MSGKLALFTLPSHDFLRPSKDSGLNFNVEGHLPDEAKGCLFLICHTPVHPGYPEQFLAIILDHPDNHNPGSPGQACPPTCSVGRVMTVMYIFLYS
ncbi:MAG: hypothetical protein JRJ39_10905 [Deltaproteobacteria bacterium]|nr:hypothetical protein [Deltaproteobacteria bacterium]